MSGAVFCKSKSIYDDFADDDGVDDDYVRAEHVHVFVQTDMGVFIAVLPLFVKNIWVAGHLATDQEEDYLTIIIFALLSVD